MKTTETKRCRNIRRVLIALFVVCGYLLSTTFISAYVTVGGKEKLITETALNLTFGSVSGSTPPSPWTISIMIPAALDSNASFFKVSKSFAGAWTNPGVSGWKSS